MKIENIDIKIKLELMGNSRELAFPNVKINTNGTYVCDEFKIDIDIDKFTGLHFYHNQNLEFELISIEYFLSFPLSNTSRIIVPDTGRHYMDTFYPRKAMFKHKYLVSGAHMSTPFFAYLDCDEKVSLSFGLMGKIIDTEFKIDSPAANEKYSLVVYDNANKWSIKKPYSDKVTLGTMTSFRDGFFQSEGDFSWFHALRRYAKIYQEHYNIKIRTNERTRSAQFCTWRVINSDKMNHQWVIDTATECKKLGINVFIFDDGWYGVGLDSDTMTNDLGDWPTTIESKFPDIRDTIKEVKKLGVHPVLWYCPTGIGRDSKALNEARDFLVENDGEKFMTPGLFYTLCPRNPGARKLMLKNLKKILSFDPDGFKPDLFNYTPVEPCTADHEHDISTGLEATKVCFEMMYNEAVKTNPEMIFMAKNDEANIDFCQYAPSIRSGDSPYDPNIMFLRCAYPGAFHPMVVNDYLMLAGPEKTRNIANCMIKQITMGVPAVSIDLLNASKEQKKVLGSWITFYNNIVKDIHRNVFIEPQDSGLSCWQRINTDNHTAMISVVMPGSTIYDLPDMDTTYILNATSSDSMFIKNNMCKGKRILRTYNHFHEKLSDEEWNPEGENSIPVPSAGYTCICRP